MFDFTGSTSRKYILYHLEFARGAVREAIIKENMNNALFWSIMCDELVEELLWIDEGYYE